VHGRRKSPLELGGRATAGDADPAAVAAGAVVGDRRVHHQKVGGGEIIVRQRGTRFRPGDGVGLARDHTIFATRPGVVKFDTGRRGRTISVVDGE
jgi:large subunit ribosomal protein L27